MPVGDPHSDTNLMEWRILFSVAERTLVWSFNYIQMQCYAVMKLILKEFIHPYCSPPCRVLCSYFLKTFLFWEYEETDPSYWCMENFKECVMRVLSNLCNCVRLRSLRHYFIPSFNLLSVNMTDQAQTEILRIFDIIIQSDISILKECNTLNRIWIQCFHRDADAIDIAGSVRRNLLRSDECMMDIVDVLQAEVLKLLNHNFIDLLTSQFISHFHVQHTVYITHLNSFAMRILLTHASISLTNIPLQSVGNKTLYRPLRFLQSNVSGIDISTCRLWYAMLMTKCGDYRLSLRIINKVLSNISPFALYYTGGRLCNVRGVSKERYVDMFSSIDANVMERARKAWLLDLHVMPSNMDMVPTAIQVDLKYCDESHGVCLSPFVCAYYRMFLNYCGLRQFDNRARALRRLIDTVNNREQFGTFVWYSYNIAGHCLLSEGETEQARVMFMRSYHHTLPHPAFHRLNSAQYYLQCLLH